MRWVPVALVVAFSSGGCREAETTDGGLHTIDAHVGPDAKPPIGSVGPTGGNVDRLAFGVFGDCRPANLNQSTAFPTATANAIFKQMHASYSQFAIGTGDYMYADNATDVNKQLATMMSAESNFGKTIFHAMGNHECDGYTNSNCPNATETPNVTAFMTGLNNHYFTNPYYEISVMTAAGEAKFIYIAANAWSTAQATWLTNALSRKTKYTFVIRHEPSYGTGLNAPGTSPSDTILAAPGVPPATLYLYGHTHTYEKLSANAVVVGNAGAPMPAYFGWLYVEQREDGNIQVWSRNVDGSVADVWAVDPNGKSVATQ
jgi:hypothetical protein